MPKHNKTFSSKKPLPWKKIILVVIALFLTGFSLIVQEYAEYFLGAIIGEEKFVLQEYSCPQSPFAFEVSPIPQLFSYVKGDPEANRKEMLRLVKNNLGLTAWFSYDKGFDQAGKVKLIDKISYEKNEEQYAASVYEAIRKDQSIHAAADFVTAQLSADNPNLATVFPYAVGYVVDAATGSVGYGNYVSVCSDLTDGVKTLRVLYSVAHLQSLSVSAGQMVKAGDVLGNIGSTGKSTATHAHIMIMPDLKWGLQYREKYNGGYKFYYPNAVREVLVKSIDPVSVMLNPDMAYSIVLDEARRQKIFESPEQYFLGLGNLVAFAGASVIADVGVGTVDAPLPITVPKTFTSFRVTVPQDSAKSGELISVMVEALDQFGAVFPLPTQDLNVVLSSPTATVQGSKSINNGIASFQVTNTNGGEVIVQVSNYGSISAEKRVVFVAAPVTITPPPSPPATPLPLRDPSTSPSSEVPLGSARDDRVMSPTAPILIHRALTPIVILPGDQYRVHEKDNRVLIVFNDREIKDDFPVEIKFTVPEDTGAVSIITGLSPNYFPDNAELKLGKFKPGQPSVSYYPKYAGSEDSYKKIVAWKDGEVLDEYAFTWSPLSLNLFTDVVKGITDVETYAAVKALKAAGVAKGNPDGSFGVDKPVNRASAVTLLIRAFYSDVRLDELKIKKVKFKDVPITAWYSSAIWFASQARYERESKPVFLKGSNGQAMPDANVKIEEMTTMILRILDVPLPATNPWYEAAIKRSIDEGIIVEADRQLIDKPLPRGKVAVMVVNALKLAEKMTGAPQSSVEVPAPILSQPSATSEPTLAPPPAEPPKPKVYGLKSGFFNNRVILAWESDFEGPFTVSRQDLSGGGEEVLGTVNARVYFDNPENKGREYRYHVKFPGDEKGEEIMVKVP